MGVEDEADGCGQRAHRLTKISPDEILYCTGSCCPGSHLRRGFDCSSVLSDFIYLFPLQITSIICCFSSSQFFFSAIEYCSVTSREPLFSINLGNFNVYNQLSQRF